MMNPKNLVKKIEKKPSTYLKIEISFLEGKVKKKYEFKDTRLFIVTFLTMSLSSSFISSLIKIAIFYFSFNFEIIGLVISRVEFRSKKIAINFLFLSE